MISFNSYGEWTKLTEDTEGETYYIDLNTIKKIDGYVYWWDLVNYVEPDDGFMSVTSFVQGDCEIGRIKELSSTSYTELTGYGEYESDTTPNPEWDYFPPDTIGGHFLELSCNLTEEWEQVSPEERERHIEEVKEYYRQLEQDNQPTIITIDKDGNYYINPMDESIPEAISFDELINIASKRIEARPEMKVFMRADKEVDYGVVLEVVTPLKNFSNLVTIGFLTEAPEELANSLIVKNQTSILQSAWVNNIEAKVRSVWNFPGANPDWFVEVLIIQNKEGKVLNITFGEDNVGNSSQAKAFKSSIERAIKKASPLPITPDASVWDKDIRFKFIP